MAIRNLKLGGTDWIKEHPTYQDLNDTNDEIIKASIVGQTQIPFSILKSAGAFTNEGNLCADRTTDADGANNTINTGTSTAFYDSTNDVYRMIFEKNSSPTRTNITSDLNNGASLTTNTYDTTNNLFDLQISAVADAFTTSSSDSYVNDFELGDITGKGLYFSVISSETESETNNLTCSQSLVLNYDASSLTLSNTVGTDIIYIHDNGTNISVYKNGAVIGTIAHTIDLQLRVAVGMARGASGSDTAVAVNSRIRVDSNFYIGTYTDSTVISDASTLTLTGDETFISVYNSATIPTGTSMKVQLETTNGDGVMDTTLTNLEDETISAYTAFTGIICVANENLVVNSITKSSSCSADTAYVLISPNTIKTSAPFIGNTATFSQNIFFDTGETFIVAAKNAAGTSFNLVTDNLGSGTHTWTFPINGTYFNLTAGQLNNAANTSNIYNITSVVTETSSRVESADTTLSENGTTLIPFTTAPTAGDVLKLTFTLETTDTTITPSWYGFGCLRYKGD